MTDTGNNNAAPMRLRAEAPRVTRLSRKALAGAGLIVSLGIGGALIYALQTRDRGADGEELYSTENRATADGLAGLPRDYTGPVLGPALPGDLGRKYAAVSGDHNPIHLYPLTARALGFKRQIAHGMWTKARAVAALDNRLPDTVTVAVGFKKPIFLPGTVTFGARATEVGIGFVVAPQEGSPHLLGRVTFG